jgi:hypothetical protein
MDRSTDLPLLVAEDGKGGLSRRALVMAEHQVPVLLPSTTLPQDPHRDTPQTTVTPPPPARTLAVFQEAYLHLDGRGAVGEVQREGGEAEHVLQQLLVHGATALRRLAFHIRVRAACAHTEQGSSGLVRRNVAFLLQGEWSFC